MPSKSYSIESWNPIGNNIVIQPSIYVKSDMDLSTIARNNNQRVMCKISKTNSPYDGCTYIGQVHSTSWVPSCRPNFFAETGFYIITLGQYANQSINNDKLYLSNPAYWLGYPYDNNGDVEISEYKM